jgi:hypothetical protein
VGVGLLGQLRTVLAGLFRQDVRVVEVHGVSSVGELNEKAGSFQDFAGLPLVFKRKDII